MSTFNKFIDKNIAPLGATKIGVYNNQGTKVGVVELENLQKTNLGQKLYSFGAISDIHLNYETAESDFIEALTYLNNNEEVAFTCIAGDLTVNGSATELQRFRELANQYSPSTQVYEIWGNHDSWSRLNGNAGLTNEQRESYTGHPLCYKFEQGNDIFIMFGCDGYTSNILFTIEQRQWLYEQLEQHRNQRVFLFTHVRPDDACGNAYGIYATDIWNGTEASVMESLYRHYKNVVLFHGHSHLKFDLQTKENKANYDNVFGIHSIHIPSLAVPRTGDVTGANSRQDLYSESEGYVVDVYQNHIVLRGRDFVAGKFLPIAVYSLDTTLQNVEEFSYIDSTGTIDTSTTYSITQSLSNATSTNNSTTVTKWTSYSNTITANEGYRIGAMSIIMNEIDITSTCYNNGNIFIEKVTGNIIINATIVSTSNPCTGIMLNNTSLTFTSKGTTQTLIATVIPNDTTDIVIWESNDNSVASVENGVVTSIKNGTCTITATCGSHSASCNITISVPKPDTSITATQGIKIDKKTGAESTSNNYGASNYIEFDNSYTYTAHCSINSSNVPAGADYSYSIIYYDANQHFISNNDLIAKADGICDKVIPNISNAKFIRVRYYLGSTSAVNTIFNGLTITCQ